MPTPKRQKWAIDCDGVLFNFNTRFIDKLNKMYKVEIPPTSSEYPDDWNYALNYVTKKQYNAVWDEICGDSYHWWRYLPAYEWSKEFITGAQNKVDMVFITARCGKDAQRATEDALAILGVRNPEVIIAYHKAEDILSSGASLFLDDKPENHMELEHAMPKGANVSDRKVKLVILDQPWNRHWTSPSVRRIKDPRELL